MSFSNITNKDKVPGRICGNPLNGLCYKACIEVDKIFDSCIRQEVLEDVFVNLVCTDPANVTTPFTFVSGKSISSRGKIKNLQIDKLPEGSCSRVRADVLIPLEIVFTDANNITATGKTFISIPYDVVLDIPVSSIVPYELEATVNAVVIEGVYVCGCKFKITCCVTSILKVVAQVDLLVPTYGYCATPPCVIYTENQCEDIFDLPLFPQ